ncbi:hypothetical protein ACH5RR_036038 [Cinchona calisaya]|uniref:CCHC-type domain-containing protein n=1 Tax=Cinchona calisaya TaxID=153742 RepID=A0ABD2Y6U8_9GENT
MNLSNKENPVKQIRLTITEVVVTIITEIETDRIPDVAEVIILIVVVVLEEIEVIILADVIILEEIIFIKPKVIKEFNFYQTQGNQRIQCYNCEKYGHRKSKYRSGEQFNINFQTNIADNQAHNNNQNMKTLFLGCNAVDIVDKNKLFLDTDCSNHMCGKKKIIF